MGYRGKRAKRVNGGAVLLIVAAVVLAALAAAYFFRLRAQRIEPDEPDSSDVSSGGTDASLSGSASSGGEQFDRSQEAPPEEPSLPAYDFSQPAPESEAVENSYFADAAFVGDSRTDGFMLYSGVGNGTNLTSNGLSIFQLTEKKALTIGGEDYTLLEALALKEYGKVYLCLGVNELGVYKDNSFYESYRDAIDQIRVVQPNAVIYIQCLIPINEEQIVAYNGNKFNLTNEHLRVYNDLMRQAAEEKQVVYLDLYSDFVDENGVLPEGASRDGVHLVKDSCVQWLDYLKTHTVAFDTLYPDGPPAVEAPDPEPAGPEPTTADGSGQG